MPGNSTLPETTQEKERYITDSVIELSMYPATNIIVRMTWYYTLMESQN